LYQGKIDVRQAYRQVPQHPAVANLFAAMVDETHLMLDFRVPFGAGHSAHAYGDFGELIRAAHGALTPAAAAALPTVPGRELMFVDVQGDASEPAEAQAPLTAAAAAEAAAAAMATAWQAGAPSVEEGRAATDNPGEGGCLLPRRRRRGRDGKEGRRESGRSSSRRGSFG